MASLTVVLLRSPERGPELSEAEQDRIQEAHLAFLTSLKERGVLATAGPFRDREDEVIRGLCVYRVDVEQARREAANDPAVKAKTLVAQAFTWWFPKGDVTI